MRVGLREANQRFSALVKVVKAGREVILTERGKPIAVLKSLADPDDDAAAVRRLEETGFLRAAKKQGPKPRWTPRPLTGPSLTETIREERDASCCLRHCRLAPGRGCTAGRPPRGFAWGTSIHSAKENDSGSP